MALTSMPVITMAALFLVVATLAVQTVATRPAAFPTEDGYAAATTTAKPVEKTGGEATTVATVKPVEQTGGEATTVATSRPAEENYAKAIEITKTADKYAMEAATATLPEKAATAKKVADLLSGMAEKAIALGDKAAKETGAVRYVTQKEIEALSAEIKQTIKPLVDAGDKSSPAFISLTTAAASVLEAERYLKEAAMSTSPEKVAASNKATNDYFISALLYIASARAEAKLPPAVAVDTVVDAKKAPDVVTPPAEAYAAKDATAKEASPKESYTAAGTV